MRLHKDVYAARGKAAEHECARGCGRQALDWANVSGEYRDVDDFEPLCRPCHQRQDKRAIHDAREDHVFDAEPCGPYFTCAECRRRRRRRAYHDRKAAA